MADYKKIQDYKDKRYEFTYPTDQIDPALKKQTTWYLQICQAMLADYTSNYCYVPFEFGQKRSFATLDAYATGQQSPDKIKDTLIGKSKKRADGTYPTKSNISYDNYYILPKMFDIMRERNMQTEYDVDVSCIDEDSLATKEAEKETLKYLVHPQTQAFMQSAGYKLPPGQDPKAMGVQTQSDVDLYFETGGYTMQREMACVAACLKTKMVSNYKLFQDNSFDDLIKLGLCGAKTYIEASTKLVKVRRANVRHCVIPYSELNDFSDITRAGEIRMMTIADIRKENPDLTGENLLYLAKSFEWLNTGFNYSASANKFSELNKNSGANIDIDPISRVRVQVLDAQWLSTDIETNLKNTWGDGKIIYKPIPYSFQQNDKSKRNGEQVIRKNVIRKYYAQWVIGTDIFLNYGVCSDVVYYGEDGNKTPRLDYFFSKTGNASLVERCIALVDDIDLAIVTQRKTLATMPAAPGMMVQKDIIENVFLNGIKQEPEDLMQGLFERGAFYYNGLDDHGKPLFMAGGAKPIDFMDISKIVGVLKTYGDIILEKVNEIREVLGIPQGTDGSTPNPYDGLGKSQLSMQASNSALYPTFNAYQYLFRAVFNDVICKWQIVAKDTGAKIGFSPLGVRSMKILELGKDFSNAEFNIDVQMGTTDAQKKQLIDSIAQQKALGDQTGGAQGLSPAEWMYIYDRVISGNEREAMYVMAQIQQKKSQAAAQAKQQDQQANIQLQQQTATQKSQNDLAAIQAKGQVDGKNDAMVELVKGFMEQNRTIMEQFIKAQAAAGSPITPQQAAANIQSNNDHIGQVVSQQSPQPQPEPMPEGYQGEQQEQPQESQIAA